MVGCDQGFFLGGGGFSKIEFNKYFIQVQRYIYLDLYI